METKKKKDNKVSEKDRLCRQGPKLKRSSSVNVAGVDADLNLAFGRICHSIRKSKADLVREFIQHFVDSHRDLFEAIDKAENEYKEKLKEATDLSISETIAA